MGIFDDEDYRVINLNETDIFLKWVLTHWDGTKLTPVIILKGEPGIKIETNMKIIHLKRIIICTYYSYENLSSPYHDFRKISN
jgi:hypothetical protein